MLFKIQENLLKIQRKVSYASFKKIGLEPPTIETECAPLTTELPGQVTKMGGGHVTGVLYGELIIVASKGA